MSTLVTPPERQATMRLQDGRTLAWSEWGPRDGRAVLFCTGAGMSGWLGFGAAALPDLGVRLLAIDRPGLGLSDAHPSKTLASWVADIRELIAAQHLDRVSAVAFSQGAPFGYVLAGAGVLAALAIVSGQDELTHPRVRPSLHPEVAALLAAVEADAAAFEQHFAQIASPDVLWQLILGMSGAHDRAVYGTDEFSTAYQRSLDEGFRQGAQGYARDLVNALSPWPVSLEHITIPIDLWYGALDTSTVHSPDYGVALAERLPHATHLVDPNAGGSILWTRARDILAQLRYRL